MSDRITHIRRALSHRAECDTDGDLVTDPAFADCPACLRAYKAREAAWDIQLAKLSRRTGGPFRGKKKR